jgi:hypothetical protein
MPAIRRETIEKLEAQLAQQGQPSTCNHGREIEALTQQHADEIAQMTDKFESHGRVYEPHVESWLDTTGPLSMGEAQHFVVRLLDTVKVLRKLQAADAFNNQEFMKDMKK